MLKALFCSGVLFFLVWSSGVRLHAGNLVKFLEWDNYEGYHLVELHNGRQLAGRVLRESDSQIEIRIGAGTVTFPKKDILSSRSLTRKEAESGRYNNLIIREKDSERPVITHRYEDSLIYPAAKHAGRLLERAGVRVSEQISKLSPFSGEELSEKMDMQSETMKKLVERFQTAMPESQLEPEPDSFLNSNGLNAPVNRPSLSEKDLSHYMQLLRDAGK